MTEEARTAKWPAGLRTTQVDLALKLATINEKLGVQVVTRAEIRRILGLHD